MIGLVLVAALGSLLAEGAQRQSVFRSSATVVSVDVSVRAGDRAVGGLGPDDFIVTDNGVPQQITAVDLATVPIDLTLVVDVSGSTAGRIAQYRAAVVEIARLLHSEDRFRLIAFATDVTEVVPLQPAARRPPVDRLTVGRLTSLNDALITALVRRVDLDRRHLIVAFSDGDDSFSVTPTSRVFQVARRAEAVLHLAISPASARVMAPVPPGANAATPGIRYGGGLQAQGGFPAEPDAIRTLELAAQATGGQRLSPGFSGSLVGAFRVAFQDFRSSYVLQYRPTGVPLEGWHSIGVTLARPHDYTVRARNGYFGG